MSMDLVRLFDDISDAGTKSRTVADGLGRLARALVREGVAVDLAAIRNLPVVGELQRLTPWFDTLFQPKPPPARANAFYFGIVEFEDGRYDFRCAALAGRGTDTEAWDWDRSSAPRPEHAASRVLDALSRPKGPVRDRLGRHVFCLGYVAIVAAHLCRARARALAARAATVAAGYDEGDFVVLGKLLPSGAFKPPRRAPPPKPATIKGSGNLFEMEDARGTSSAWFLNSPKGARGRELPYEFGQSGRRIRPEAIHLTPHLKGTAVDVSFTVGGDLIARKPVRALIDALSPGAVQWLPATVEGTAERFAYMNLLGVTPSRKLLGWARAHRKSVAEAPLGKHKIARIDKWGRLIVVTRDLAEAIVGANVTGATFVALQKSRLT